MAVLARMRWKIELDYRELKGQLGLDHYEGRSWLGWYHHTALVTAAHGFLTLERQHQIASGRPDTPEGGPAPAAALQVLAGRCSTCQQPVDIDDIPLTLTAPQTE